jgi:hypothetical protein
MLTTNEKKIDVYNCKLLCPLQFDVGYINEFIKHSMIIYPEITAVTGCFEFGADISCLKLFAYTVGETVNCQKEISISDKTTHFH